jgi:hydroxyacylglutathione hydrolase
MYTASPALEFEVVPVTPFFQNCTLLRCTATGKGAIVDPGGDVDNILFAVERAGLEVERVLLTHGHVDHIGGAGELVRRLGLPAEGPQVEDRFLVDTVGEKAAEYGLEASVPFEVSRWLEGGDTVSVGELELEVLHCPGHTPGHVAFYHRPSHFALVGDVLFRGSIGRTDFPGGDYDTLIHSIHQVLLPLGDEVTFLSGHGPTSTFAEERLTDPFITDPDRYRPI